MNSNNVDVVVCLNHKPEAWEFHEIESALSRIRGVRGVTLNNHVTRLVNVSYDPAQTRARAILDSVVRGGHGAARLVGM